VIVIDGSMGEGGGQVLRTSLALSLLTGAPVRIGRIRAGRPKPGLMRQHLAAVRAAAAVSGAEVLGADLGSTELELRPGPLVAGDYRFAVGSAGSTTLVMQTVLLPLLLRTTAPTTLRFEGGTHNPMAPPFDYLARCYLPLLSRMGGRVDLALERHGFYPAGGGAWTATVYPATRLGRLELLERGVVHGRTASALCAQLSGAIGVRQVRALSAALGWESKDCAPLMIFGTHGPGNALIATVESEHVTEQFTGFGERGLSSERVAARVVEAVRRYLSAEVPVGEHLADQLLLPLALGEGGAFRTLEPSRHCLTQLELVRLVLGTRATAVQQSPDVWRIDVTGRSG
jgi:RNA 3'-terminal phosphate cyclase (ATP)